MLQHECGEAPEPDSRALTLMPGLAPLQLVAMRQLLPMANHGHVIQEATSSRNRSATP